jgi:hypothetical protein
MAELKLLVSLLEEWDRRWRYPALSLALATSKGELTAEDMARYLVDGLASAVSPHEFVRRLTREGKLGLAQTLLEDAEFQEALADDLADTRNDVEAECDRAGAVATTRIGALAARLERLRPPLRPRLSLKELDALPELARSDRAEAERRLAAMEDEVASAESRCADELRERLREASRTLERLDAELDAWIRAVRRCIDGGRFDIARHLIHDGPAVEPSDDPDAVPSLPGWSWPGTLEDALGWLGAAEPTGIPAPPDLLVWRPRPDDVAGRRLLDAVAAVAREGLEGAAFAELATALDVALRPSLDEPQERADPEAAEGILRALDEPRVRSLAFFAAAPARLRPVTADVTASIPGVLWFSLEPDDAGGWPRIHARDLLALVATPRHRRTNLLRLVARQLGRDAALDSALASVPGQMGQAAYVRWLLDVLGIRASPMLPDVVAYAAGGRDDLLLSLARSLVATAMSDPQLRSELTLDDVADALRSVEFRQTLDDALMRPLRNEPAARALLAAAMLCEADDPGNLFDDTAMREWLAEFDPEPMAEIETPMALLIELGLVEAIGDGRYRVPASGVYPLLRQEFGAPEDFGSEAVRRP